MIYIFLATCDCIYHIRKGYLRVTEAPYLKAAQAVQNYGGLHEKTFMDFSADSSDHNGFCFRWLQKQYHSRARRR